MALLMLTGLFLVGMATPALALGIHANDQVIIFGQVDIGPQEVVGDVVIFHGPIKVEGDVEDSVIAFDGAVTISGHVRYSVISFRGPVTIANGGHVGGDIFSRDTPTVAPGATVDGRLRQLNVTGLSFFWLRFVVWVAYGLSVLALGLLLVFVAPRALDAAFLAAQTATGGSIGWGLALFFGLPVAAVLALVTLVGIPLGLALLFGLALLYTIGYTFGAWILGRTLRKPPAGRAQSFLVGWAIVQAAILVPFAGPLVWLAAAVVGLGTLIVATWRARRPAAFGPRLLKAKRPQDPSGLARFD
jgi:hypothetical protein